MSTYIRTSVLLRDWPIRQVFLISDLSFLSRDLDLTLNLDLNLDSDLDRELNPDVDLGLWIRTRCCIVWAAMDPAFVWLGCPAATPSLGRRRCRSNVLCLPQTFLDVNALELEELLEPEAAERDAFARELPPAPGQILHCCGQRVAPKPAPRLCV